MDKKKLLKDIKGNLDLKAILKANPGLTDTDVDDFFAKIQESLGLIEDAPVKNAAPKSETLKLYTDGASRGNPGPAAVGCVLFDGDDNVLLEKGKVIGNATNNVAEYNALLYGLELALQYTPKTIAIYSDSELLVKQMTGVYKTKNGRLSALKDKAVLKLKQFESYSFTSIPRDKNSNADSLANKALDQQLID